jgi:hypothetical protein
MSHRSLVRTALPIVLLAAASLGANCPPTPTPRGAGTDGSARWAWNIAKPQVTGDFELRQILGAKVELDGRLPSNTGDWSFVTYSPSTQKVLQLTVAADSSVTNSTRAEAAPGPGIVRPLPDGWADSIAVFHATDGKRDAGAHLANLAVLNVASYANAANQAAWGINFDAGVNQIVSVDGNYVGPQ